MSKPQDQNLLESFMNIEQDEYLLKVRFYEENKPIIQNLDKDLFYMFKYEYVLSLFSLGYYSLFINEVDPLIEYVFMHNVQYRKIDTFEELLFLKAASLLNMKRYKDAKKIAQQLVSINDYPLKYYALLFQCNLYDRISFLARYRLLAIIIILSSSVLFALRWIWGPSMPPFAQSTLQTVSIVSISLILVIVLMAWSIGYVSSKTETNRQMKDIRSRNRKKQKHKN